MNFGYSCSDLVKVYEVEITLHGLIGSSDCPVVSEEEWLKIMDDHPHSLILPKVYLSQRNRKK